MSERFWLMTTPGAHVFFLPGATSAWSRDLACKKSGSRDSDTARERRVKFGPWTNVGDLAVVLWTNVEIAGLTEMWPSRDSVCFDDQLRPRTW